MLHSKSDLKTIKRYVLFQIPELVLTILILVIVKYFWDFPLWIAYAIIAVSITKDVILYHYTWRSYVVQNKEDVSNITGSECHAVDDFDRTGLVRFKGELWQAHTNSPVQKGDSLQIVRVKGLVLYVEKK